MKQICKKGNKRNKRTYPAGVLSVAISAGMMAAGNAATANAQEQADPAAVRIEGVETGTEQKEERKEAEQRTIPSAAAASQEGAGETAAPEEAVQTEREEQAAGESAESTEATQTAAVRRTRSAATDIQTVLPLDQQGELLIFTGDTQPAKVQVLYRDGSGEVRDAEGAYSYTPKNSQQIRETVDAVKQEFQNTAYEDLYDYLNPYVRGIDRLEIQNQLKAEKGGVTPTSTEVEQRVRQVYMDRLDMRSSFEKVKGEIDEILSGVLEHSVQADRRTITDNRLKILTGLTYLERQYSFRFGGFSAKDLILFYPEVFGTNGDTLTNLIQIGTLGYEDMKLANSAATYRNRLSGITGQADIIEFAEYGVATFTQKDSVEDWMKETTKAYLVEADSPYATTSLLEKMKREERLKSHFIPLLTLTQDNLYVITTMSTIHYGLADTYIDRGNEAATKETFLADLKKTAAKQEAFLDFWYRISEKKEVLTGGATIVVVDTLQKYSNDPYASAKNLWSPKSGDGAMSGVREFITPLNLYANYFTADGQANGKTSVSLFLAKGLTDRGQSVYTHELTHILDEQVWFNGYKRRDGQKAEVFARGLFESINNTDGVSAYDPIFNLNTTYTLGEGRNQNRSPLRFETEADLKEYMQGLLDVIYTLDYAEANAILKLDAESRSILLNQLVSVPDASRPGQVKDRFQNITQEQAAALQTVYDLVEQGMVSGRLEFQGIQTVGDVEPNGYYVVPLFDPIFAAIQNDQGAPGDISFRRNAYELLGEYGYKDGMAAYLSNQYQNDGEALRAILDDSYQGSLSEFKKEMFRRRAERTDDLKPTAQFQDFDELERRMKEAVEQDLAVMRANRTNRAGAATGADAVQNLKRSIFQEYLRLTEDFQTSIYKEKASVEEPSIIYVRNGDENAVTGAGTEAMPYDSLQYALSKAKDGDIIRLVEDIQYRQQWPGQVFAIDKDVTIEGQGHRLTFKGPDLELKNNLTLRDLTLNMIPDAGKQTKIYVGGHELTLDGVSTTIGPQQAEERPTLVGGTKDGSGLGSHTKITVLNGSSDTRFRKIIAGNESGDSDIPVTITIRSEFAQVDEGIFLGGGDDAQVTGAVKVFSDSKNIKKIDGTNSIDQEVILSRSRISNLQLEQIGNLTLEDGAELTLSRSSEIAGNIKVLDGAALVVTAQGTVTAGALEGEGEILLSAASDLKVTHSLGAVQIKVRGFESQLAGNVGKIYVSAEGTIEEGASVTLENGYGTYSMERDGNVFKLISGSTLPVLHTITLRFIDQGNVVKEEEVEVETGGSIEQLNAYLPTVSGERYFYVVADHFDRETLRDLTEDTVIEIPLVRRMPMEPIRGFDKSDIRKIELVTVPKAEYVEGETLDLSGLQIRLEDAGGIKVTIGEAAFAEYGIQISKDPATPLTTGDTGLEISAGGQSLSLPLTVRTAPQEQKSYTVEIRYTHQGKIVGTYTVSVKEGEAVEGVEDHIPAAPLIGTFRIKDSFDRTLLLQINAHQEIEVPLVNVVDPATLKIFDRTQIIKMELLQVPEKRIYGEGERLDLGGLELRLTDINGISRRILASQLSDYHIDVTPGVGDVLQIGQTELTVKLGAWEIRIPVEVKQSAEENPGGSETDEPGNKDAGITDPKEKDPSTETAERTEKQTGRTQSRKAGQEKAATAGNTPRTGEGQTPWGYLGALLISFCGIGIFRKKRKESETEKDGETTA